MYEQEKQRSIHLMVLCYNTILIIGFIAGAFYLKLDMWATIMFLVGLCASWIMHITEKIPESMRLWLYIILSMLAFSYYGIYEMELFDLTFLIMLFLLICTNTEERVFVRLCAIVYYPTVCYKAWLTYGNLLKLPVDTLSKIIIHFIVVLTAERLAEAMIRRRGKEREKETEKMLGLQEANQRAENFLTNVSHELRTPINAVTGITTMMLKSEDDPEKREDIFSIQMAGNRLFSQIEDILDYTEIDTGKIIVSDENYMILSLINDIIVENRLMRREKELELIFDVDAGIPATLLGDGKKIKKIIKHLIDNAIKFTNRGGVYVRIYALNKSYGINLCIVVSDTGIGMEEEELEKIRERYFQSNGGRNRKAGGLGLGLSIVYGMVTAMDGFIRIESTKGSGTTVSVSIPQKVVDAAPSMEVPNRSDLCIGLYLRPEKYEVPEVRDYYNATITHLIQKLDIALHRVFDLEELKRLVAMYQLTHLIIGKEEYEESISYFELLNAEIEVVVVADDHFLPAENSNINLVKKPFYGLPIINILNSQISYEIEALENENMICPGVRVLVVDDEPMNLMVAEGIFNAYQMQVKTAGSGREAIELFEREGFDLIFLDHMMPEMDGVETLKILRRTEPGTQKETTFIAFTANAVSGAKEMFLQEGFDEFISKPIEDQELKRLLRKVLPKTSISYIKEEDRKKISLKQEKKQVKIEDADVQEPIPEEVPGTDKLVYLEEKGFHTGAGLQYCRGDREFYEGLLMQFAKSAENKITDIEGSFRQEDYKNYQILVHALKSSSKMIGADTLSEMAKAAEEAAKNQDAAYIKENHGDILDKYKEVVQSIFDVLSPEEDASAEETKTAGEEVSKEELLKQLSELKQCLDTFEADRAETLIAEMSGLAYEGRAVSELLHDVKQDVEDFELGAAAEKVETIIRNTEGGAV